jgi:ABC-type antimicrobial peptide transport system permease subunit
MRSGRDLGSLDQHAVVVNASLARLLDPAGNALGRQIRIEGAARQIVGVIPDTVWSDNDQAPKFRAIVLMPARGSGGAGFAVEVAGNPSAYVAAVRNELAAGHTTTTSIKTLRQHYNDSLFAQRTATKALYGIGLLALLLTASGLHGITSALLARRSKEFSIRLALGATPGRIMSLVFRGGLKLTAIGLLVGLGIAVPAAVVVASKLHGFSPWSVAALGLSSAIVVVTGIAAAAQPARRVLRLQPADIIRAE